VAAFLIVPHGWGWFRAWDFGFLQNEPKARPISAASERTHDLRITRASRARLGDRPEVGERMGKKAHWQVVIHRY
jgi:hypothetical protein